MERELAGKNFLVTGSSNGIGKAISADLRKNGARVFGLARSFQRETQNFGQVNPDDIFCDITDRNQVHKTIQLILDEVSTLDGIILNAGTMLCSFVKNAHYADWDNMINVNLIGNLNCLGGTLPKMIEQQFGDIIFVGSLITEKPFKGSSVYAASKASIHTFARCLPDELAEYPKIKITLISPGAVATGIGVGTSDKEFLRYAADFPPTASLQPSYVAQILSSAILKPNRSQFTEIKIEN